MEKILFRDADHSYHRESDGMALMSVSGFKNIWDSTNWEHNRLKKAAQEYLGPHYARYKNEWEDQGRHILDPAFIEFLTPHLDKKLFKKLRDKVAKQWADKGDTAAAKGTIEHGKKEAQAHEQGYWICPVDGETYPLIPHNKKPNGDNESIDLSNLVTGYYPELLLYYWFPEPVFSESMGKEICGVAGQTDKAFVNRERGYIYIGDFKFTEKELSWFAPFYANFGKEKFTGPFGHIDRSKLSGYQIQLSTYAWKLSQATGLEVAGLYIENYYGKEFAYSSMFELPYLRAEVSDAISEVFINGL